MDFTPITEAELPKRTRENTKSGNLLNKFVESGATLARVDLDEGAKVASVRSTLNNYVKTHNLPVKVSTAGDAVVLRLVSADEAQEAASTDEG